MVLVPVSQSVGHACSGRSIHITHLLEGEIEQTEMRMLGSGRGLLFECSSFVDKEYETKACEQVEKSLIWDYIA